MPASRGSGYWMASVPPDYATTPEEFLEVVVARRHVFGVTDRGTVVGTVRYRATGSASICRARASWDTRGSRRSPTAHPIFATLAASGRSCDSIACLSTLPGRRPSTSRRSFGFAPRRQPPTATRRCSSRFRRKASEHSPNRPGNCDRPIGIKTRRRRTIRRGEDRLPGRGRLSS